MNVFITTCRSATQKNINFIYLLIWISYKAELNVKFKRAEMTVIMRRINVPLVMVKQSIFNIVQGNLLETDR